MGSKNTKSDKVRKTSAIMFILLLTMGFILALVPTVPADVTGSDAIGICSVWDNSFTVVAKWAETGDDLELRLYLDNVPIATEDLSSWWNTEGGTVSYSPLKVGVYKAQLWSITDSKEVNSWTWTVPKIQISLEVSPTTGQIGTMYVATTSFDIGSGSPDYYSFSGLLELTAATTTIKQMVSGTLFSAHYFTYYGVTNPGNHLFTAFGFTFPAAGSYSIGAKYSDSLTSVTATSASVTVTDQYTPLLNQQKSDLGKTKDDLNATKVSVANLDATQTAKNSDQDSAIQSATNMAYAGIAIGVVGMIMGIVGIAMAAKKGKPAPEPVMAAPQPHPATTYAPPPAPPVAQPVPVAQPLHQPPGPPK